MSGVGGVGKGRVGAVRSVSRVGRAVLLGCAVGLALVSLLSWQLSGFGFAIGSIRVSATDASRILLQAAVIWLLAALVPRPAPPGALRALLPVLAVMLAAVLDSSPRRVGDGHEFMAMALNLSRGALPALLPGELESVTQELRAMPGYGDATLDEPLIGDDGRQDFYHFWLYPLIVAPVIALARVAGAHVNHAFTFVNVLLFASMLYWLVRNGRSETAALIGAGPLLWWIDKAHAEIFLFVALAFAVLLIDRAPGFALIAAAVAAAQNPAALIVLGISLASMALPGRRASFAAIVIATAIAAVPPTYYYWHLGTLSPLSSTIQRTLPGLRAIVTPVLDPNLGLLVYAPALCAIACAGFAGHSRRRLLVAFGAGLALLVVFAESPNVNHGGSPGMSRYALWILALAVPFVAEGSSRLARRSRMVLYAACAASVVFSVAVFRPAWPDRAGNSPSWLASMLWTHMPALDNPIPEVFAERTLGRDGFVRLPAATGLCEKVLTVGDGQDAWWPVPCEPRPAPAECAASGALCYVNAGAYSLVPRQVGFAFNLATEHSWTVKGPRRFDQLLARLGDGLRISRLDNRGGRFAGDTALEHLFLVEGSAGSAAWVRVMARAVEAPDIVLDVTRPSRVEVLDENLGVFRAPVALPTGIHPIDLPPAPPLVVLVTDER